MVLFFLSLSWEQHWSFGSYKESTGRGGKRFHLHARSIQLVTAAAGALRRTLSHVQVHWGKVMWLISYVCHGNGMGMGNGMSFASLIIRWLGLQGA